MSLDNHKERKNENIDLTQYLLGSTSVDTLINAQRKALFNPGKEGIHYGKTHLQKVSQHIDIKGLFNIKGLEWMNIDGYLKTVSASINSPVVWEYMLEDAKSRLNIRQLATAYEVPITYGNGVVELSPILTTASEAVLGFTTDLLFLAAAAGNDFKRYIKQSAQSAPAYNAAMTLAEHFGTPAADHQILITRLRSLFPYDDKTPSLLTAFETLDTTDAWGKMRIPIYTNLVGKKSADIPYTAIEFLRKEYHAFGQLLAEPDTAEKIVATIKKSDTIVPFRGLRRISFGPWKKHSA